MRDSSYQVKFDQRGNFIHAMVTGPNTAETVIRYMDEIKQECDRRDCYRVLIEEKLDGPRFDEMEIFSLIDNAHKYILMDMFLFNSYTGKSEKVYRRLCSELMSKLVKKKNGIFQRTV